MTDISVLFRGSRLRLTKNPKTPACAFRSADRPVYGQNWLSLITAVRSLRGFTEMAHSAANTSSCRSKRVVSVQRLECGSACI